jgi:predicted Fe-Mo cluster-binding NifX family protein
MPAYALALVAIDGDNPRGPGRSHLKIAIPTDDGIRVAPRFWRAHSFVVADIEPGHIKDVERRRNMPRLVRAGRSRPDPWRDRYRAVAEVVSDCRTVIAGSIGDTMRRTLGRRGIEVVVTSEDLVDRAMALFALLLLRDESRIDPQEAEIAEAIEPIGGAASDREDEFDG